MDHKTPEPAGRGSLMATPVAVAVAAAALATVTEKPTVVPVDTGVASAVFVMDRIGTGVGVTARGSHVPVEDL